MSSIYRESERCGYPRLIIVPCKFNDSEVSSRCIGSWKISSIRANRMSAVQLKAADLKKICNLSKLNSSHETLLTHHKCACLSLEHQRGSDLGHAHLASKNKFEMGLRLWPQETVHTRTCTCMHACMCKCTYMLTHTHTHLWQMTWWKLLMDQISHLSKYQSENVRIQQPAVPLHWAQLDGFGTFWHAYSIPSWSTTFTRNGPGHLQGAICFCSILLQAHSH